VHGQPDLLQIVDALGTTGSLTRGLDRGQQQRDQDGNDCDDHEKFDQSEGATTAHRQTPCDWTTEDV